MAVRDKNQSLDSCKFILNKYGDVDLVALQLELFYCWIFKDFLKIRNFVIEAPCIPDTFGWFEWFCEATMVRYENLLNCHSMLQKN